MIRTQNGFWDDADWKCVSQIKPCPVCAATQGCRLHEAGAFASCQSTPSDWPLVTGQWLHRTSEEGLALLPTG
jgi:hypothetical protein